MGTKSLPTIYQIKLLLDFLNKTWCTFTISVEGSPKTHNLSKRI